MAMLYKVKLLKTIKISITIILNNPEHIVENVVSFVLPIAPNVGQPKIIEKKPKNNVGINNLSIGTAITYCSPPNINIPYFAHT